MSRILIAGGVLAAAALVSGPATATQVVVGDSAYLVIDVEFWGREQFITPDPNDPADDVFTYGDPVRGTFRIHAGGAPQPSQTSAFLDFDDAVVYGRDSAPAGGQGPASFVESRWLSPFPAGITRDVGPFPGAVADDFVTIGDAVRFFPDEPDKDWFQVADGFTQNFRQPGEEHEQLFIGMSTPLDIIQGLSLDQEFEVEDVSGFGFLRAANTFFGFIVDRVRVTPRICRP